MSYILDRACDHGDEHVIKFSDTATEAYTRSGDPGALAAAILAGQLIESPALNAQQRVAQRRAIRIPVRYYRAHLTATR